MKSSGHGSHGIIHSLNDVRITATTDHRTQGHPMKRKSEEVTVEEDAETRHTTQRLSIQLMTNNSLPLKKRTTDKANTTQQLGTNAAVYRDEKNKDIRKVSSASMTTTNDNHNIEKARQKEANFIGNMKYLNYHEYKLKCLWETKLKQLENEENKIKARSRDILSNFSKQHQKLTNNIAFLNKNIEEVTKQHEEHMRNMTEKETSLTQTLEEKTDQMSKQSLDLQRKKDRLNELSENIAYIQNQENDIISKQSEVDEKIIIMEKVQAELMETIRDKQTALQDSNTKLTQMKQRTAQLREEVKKLDDEKALLKTRVKEESDMQEELNTQAAGCQKTVEKLRRIQDQTVKDISAIKTIQQKMESFIMTLGHISSDWSPRSRRSSYDNMKQEQVEFVVDLTGDGEEYYNHECKTEIVKCESSEIQIKSVFSLDDI